MFIFPIKRYKNIIFAIFTTSRMNIIHGFDIKNDFADEGNSATAKTWINIIVVKIVTYCVSGILVQ
jgi:hypothetical protein